MTLTEDTVNRAGVQRCGCCGRDLFAIESVEVASTSLVG